MKKVCEKMIIKFNTSYGSSNLGDFIINESIDREMSNVFKNCFVLNYPTHTPIVTFYQACSRNLIIKNCERAAYKFMCGTNILSGNMVRPWPNWNVNIFNCRPYRNTILVGCGMGGDFEKANIYTRALYGKILSREFIHSTRDEKTRLFLKKMGYKAINTGCPTLWSLTKDFCKTIPQEKSSRVIFTLTDYCKDREKDQQLIDILNKQYVKVYFWIQGSDDLEYLKSFKNIDNIELVSPNLDAYEEVLNTGDIDYVGTRLHAGIYAMRHKVRSIILIVDNRARDMKETYNLVALERDDINEKLESLINSRFKTDVRINEKKIAEWKAQFS